MWIDHISQILDCESSDAKIIVNFLKTQESRSEQYISKEKN